MPPSFAGLFPLLPVCLSVCLPACPTATGGQPGCRVQVQVQALRVLSLRPPDGEDSTPGATPKLPSSVMSCAVCYAVLSRLCPRARGFFSSPRPPTNISSCQLSTSSFFCPFCIATLRTRACFTSLLLVRIDISSPRTSIRTRRPELTHHCAQPLLASRASRRKAACRKLSPEINSSSRPVA